MRKKRKKKDEGVEEKVYSLFATVDYGDEEDDDDDDDFYVFT